MLLLGRRDGTRPGLEVLLLYGEGLPGDWWLQLTFYFSVWGWKWVLRMPVGLIWNDYYQIPVQQWVAFSHEGPCMPRDLANQIAPMAQSQFSIRKKLTINGFCGPYPLQRGWDRGVRSDQSLGKDASTD